MELKLKETFSHSGVFKGLAKVLHSQEKVDPAEVSAYEAIRAVYGDKLTFVYRGKHDPKGIARLVSVHKGSDAVVVPFTKRFKDPSIAVSTQFMVAEAYFELAKRHRELNHRDLARKEIEQGRKLLQEAIRDYPNAKVRAQADYLLANLEIELANELRDRSEQLTKDIKKLETELADTTSPEDKQQLEQKTASLREEKSAATREMEKHYAVSVTLFSNIVSTYPDSEYAPKSQYKKALAYERVGQIDNACEEYVKLSYRYPKSELVADTIARLGKYFRTKGLEYKKQADAMESPVEAEKIRIQSRKMFTTAGQVFSRLSERFPDHKLAGLTLAESGKCFMQAEKNKEAVEVFKRVIDNRDADKDIRAQTMFWCGMAYLRLEDFVNSYRTFKNLTWDYPATEWAKYARGRLVLEESLQNVAKKEK